MSTESALWAEVEAAAVALGTSAEAAVREKISELRLRHLYRCFPNDRVKPAGLTAFLYEVLGTEPSAELLASVLRHPRAGRLTEEERIELERRQHNRCAVCGCFLNAAARPHLDHLIPVAFGGPSDHANYQLLCAKCNQGKGAALDWIMASPFFIDGGSSVTPRLRFCVLARAGGQCERTDCDATTRSSELVVLPRVPFPRGGRYVFDNLMVACEAHAREVQQREVNRTAMLRAAQKYNLPAAAANQLRRR